MLFSYYFQCSIWIWKKKESLKIQDGGREWRHLYGCGCHGNQLDTTWFRLIESAKRVHYVQNIKSIGWMVSKVEKRGPIYRTPLPLMPSCNFFRLMRSRVNLSSFPCFAVRSSSAHEGNFCKTRLRLPSENEQKLFILAIFCTIFPKQVRWPPNFFYSFHWQFNDLRYLKKLKKSIDRNLKYNWKRFY